LRPLSPSAPFGAVLRGFEPAFVRGVQTRLLARLGFKSAGDDLDAALVDRVFAFLEASRAPFDRFFFDWYGGFASEKRAVESPATAHYRGRAFAALLELFELYAPADPSRLARPYFQREGPCSMHIDEVERVWQSIAERDDWSAFDAKIAHARELGDALSLEKP
jgi:uncharacterized protein YdiU (UPF0061 family)